ncbi:hypothetical protein [Desulfosediminicola ganghwensis]|uniref:hypothetical protein n=1 Tax=Desulfosediminicola ganghwensis TaxID=2569540 RepID=UPI0010AD9EEE|nr:hypothetical protein [Desulfosediminicola ganghwensis]
MEQYTESQYDDDLTIDNEEYDDSFETSDFDLFAFAGEDDSPISRLKTLVLSLDWEITDTVLQQFNDEIVDLKDVWADDKINMVYLQALEKIGKYIYREKADAHPKSIRLLLNMYYNLERIVLSDELDAAEKKQILIQDVRRFEKLKKLISGPALDEEVPVDERGGVMEPDVAEVVVEQQTAPELFELKALVFGIDWEITEQQLLELRNEVKNLQQVYADSRPRLVFLQGIGTIGTYIRKRKVDSHPDAFKILRSFFDGLEKIVQTPGITLDEEKKVLIPEVRRFEAFKKIIETEKSAPKKEFAPSAPGPIEAVASVTPAIAPAFSDLPDDGVRGFQEEEEAAALGADNSANVDARLSSFFGDGQKAAGKKPVQAKRSTEEQEAEKFSAAFFGADTGTDEPCLTIDREAALKGVEVETDADDDSDEERLPAFGGDIAPALADSDEISSFSEQELSEASVAAPAEPAAELRAEVPATPVVAKKEIVEPFSEPATEPVVEPSASIVDSAEDEIDGRLASFFDKDDGGIAARSAPSFSSTPAELALQGVDVETDGDEDNDIELEPITGPALGGFEPEPERGPSPAFESAPAPQVIEPALEEIFEEPVAQPEPAPFKPAPAFADLENIEEESPESDQPESDIESEVVSEVESQLDQFFNFEAPVQAELPPEEEQVVVESANEEVEPVVAPEVVEADIMEALPPDEPFAAEPQEDEIVFDLAEEAEFVVEDLSVEFEPEAEEINVPTAAAEEAVAEQVEEPVIRQQTGRFAELQGCIQSLELQLDDSIITGLYSELKKLRESEANTSLEKSYLQLISTVCQHIDKFRYDSDDRSNGLLQAILSDLRKSSVVEPAAAQETLLTHTGNVLQWQHEMLSEAAEARAERKVSHEQEQPVAESYQTEETAATPQQLLSDQQLADVVRREIDMLRDTLKREINELRKAMNNQ